MNDGESVPISCSAGAELDASMHSPGVLIPDVELRELRYFVAVAEELHFTRAADRLHVTQQALSTAIQRLEARLGGELFERTTRSVRLTSAGHVLLPLARQVLASARIAVETARHAIRGVGGELDLGVSPPAYWPAAPILTRDA
jgi:DNA-binding transcriptional LysR family regulator